MSDAVSPIASDVAVEGEAVRSAQLRAVMAQTPLSLGVSFAIAAFTALVLRPDIGDRSLAIWLGMIFAITAVRGIAVRRFNARHASGPFPCRPWLLASLAGSFAIGAAWGTADIAFSFHSIAYRLFFASVIGGLCAGTAAVNSAFAPVVIAFIVASTAPLILSFGTAGTTLDTICAVMIAIFTSALCVSAVRAQRAFCNLTRLQIKVERREQELSTANDKLRAEMLERQAIEARLQQAQKMEALGQLAGGIAHDFNNVLQVIISAASLIENGTATTDVRQLAAAMNEAANRGASITGRLLAFARRSELLAQSFDLARVLSNIAEISKSALGAGVRIQLDIADRLPPLLADKSQLETVLLNLTSNARDAMPSGGTLTLAADLDTASPVDAQARPAIRIRVADTGIGMDPQTLRRALEPFFTTKPRGQGTGLGLSMAKGFAEQSGGALSVESAPGVGTTVSLWLPSGTVSTKAEEPAGTPSRSASIRTPLILLIDDDALILSLLRDQLTLSGYRVACADGPQSALQLLASGTTPDVLISDLSMPDMDGIAAIRKIHAQYGAIPTILLTGFAGEAAALESDGAVRFRLLRKPVSGSALASMVAALLESDASAQDQPAGGGAIFCPASIHRN